MFYNDIQGMGATTLAGILGGLRAKGEEPTALGDQIILIAGAGSAGVGVAQVLMQAMMEHGRSVEEAKKCSFVADERANWERSISVIAHITDLESVI